MFIDYLTLVMINLVAGTALLDYYLWRGIDEADQRPYAAAFFGIGLLSLIAGLNLSLTWPLPGSYNVGYGETLPLSLALSFLPQLSRSGRAGIDAVIVGLCIFSLQLTAPADRPASTCYGSDMGSHILWFTVGSFGKFLEVGPCHADTGK